MRLTPHVADALRTMVWLVLSASALACDGGFARVGVVQRQPAEASPPMTVPSPTQSDAAVPIDANVWAGAPGARAAIDASVTTLPAVDAGIVDASTAVDAALEPSCGAQIAVCDPIANTGCEATLPRQRCEIDLTAGELSGVCVIAATPSEDGGCISSPPVSTCPVSYTCLDLEDCRKICLCDSQCESGQCCVTPIGDQGFKTCGEC